MDAVIAPFAFVDATSISTGNCKSRLGGCIFINLSEVKALNIIVQEDHICCYVLELYHGKKMVRSGLKTTAVLRFCKTGESPIS